MKHKIWILSLFTLLIMIMGVYGADNFFAAPTSSSFIKGTYIFNITSSENLNCTIIGTSTLSGDSITIYTFNNTAAFNTSNASVDTNVLDDASDWEFTATCVNSSNRTNTITPITSVIVDNDIPDTPTLSSPAEATILKTKATTTFTVAVNNTETTACTYIIYRGSAVAGDDINYVTGIATQSGNTCYFTKDFTQGNIGTWNWRVTASDGLNSTTQSLATYKNSIPTGGSISLGGGTPEAAPAVTAPSGTAAGTTMPTGKPSLQLLIDWIVNLFKSIFNR